MAAYKIQKHNKKDKSAIRIVRTWKRVKDPILRQTTQVLVFKYINLKFNILSWYCFHL